MSDDALIAGAAAPNGRRLIRSRAVLDGLWVIVVASALLVSSAIALVDLPNQSLRTGDSPLRVWVVGLPLISIGLAVVGMAGGSTRLTAVATGLLAPPVGFAGSLASSLFLDDDSAFADAGVAVSLAAAFIGAVMLARWFVYHPADVLAEESRPIRSVATVLTLCGMALAAVIVGTAVIEDRSTSAAFVLSTAAMATVPATIIGAGLQRTRDAMLLAGTAGVGLVIAVLVVRIEQSTVPLDSIFVVRAGPIGLVGAFLAVILCGVGYTRHIVDESPDAEANDDASWRWTSTD